MTRISLNAEAINHGTTLRSSACREEYAGNWPRFLSFVHKVIFQSSPLCSGGGYTLRIHRHTYSPQTTRIWPLNSDITFVIMRIYILLDPMYSVYCGRCTCSPGIACAVYEIRVTSSNDVPPKHQSRHAISRFLSIETANFCTKCLLPNNSRRISHSMVVHLSFTFTINPIKCFRVIGLRLQLTAIGVNISFAKK